MGDSNKQLGDELPLLDRSAQSCSNSLTQSWVVLNSLLSKTAQKKLSPYAILTGTVESIIPVVWSTFHFFPLFQGKEIQETLGVKGEPGSNIKDGVWDRGLN